MSDSFAVSPGKLSEAFDLRHKLCPEGEHPLRRLHESEIPRHFVLGTEISGVLFARVLFSGLNALDARFTDCRFLDTVFEASDFVHVTFERCHFKRAQFRQCSLRHVHFSDCTLDECGFPELAEVTESDDVWFDHVLFTGIAADLFTKYQLGQPAIRFESVTCDGFALPPDLRADRTLSLGARLEPKPAKEITAPPPRSTAATANPPASDPPPSAAKPDAALSRFQSLEWK